MSFIHHNSRRFNRQNVLLKDSLWGIDMLSLSSFAPFAYNSLRTKHHWMVYPVFLLQPKPPDVALAGTSFTTKQRFIVRFIQEFILPGVIFHINDSPNDTLTYKSNQSHLVHSFFSQPTTILSTGAL